jgi:predicted Zn-dependent protease
MIERLLAGEAALGRGELDAAERLFTQIAGADPRNAIALAGLARVAIRRDDPDRARMLAQQALALDPAEAAASRLLSELDRPALPDFAEPASAATHESATAARTDPPVPASPAGWRAWLARLLRRT